MPEAAQVRSPCVSRSDLHRWNVRMEKSVPNSATNSKTINRICGHFIKMRNAINFQPRVCSDVVGGAGEESEMEENSSRCLFTAILLGAAKQFLCQWVEVRRSEASFLRTRKRHVNTFLITFASPFGKRVGKQQHNELHEQMNGARLPWQNAVLGGGETLSLSYCNFSVFGVSRAETQTQ